MSEQTEQTSIGKVAIEAATGFPNLDDGDVLIVSSTGHVWKLHSVTLRNASTVLRDLLDGHEAARANKRRKDEVRSIRWRLHMFECEQKPEETRLRSFKVVDPCTKLPLFVPKKTNGIRSKYAPYNKVYDNFFRCLYNLEPVLSPPIGEDISSFILDAVSLLKAAECLGAGHTVRVTIEASCLRLNQAIWKHIAQNSSTWTGIALRLRSAVLFRAAMAHVVGRFDLRGRDGIKKEFLRSQPNGPLLIEFAEKKAAELQGMKLTAERFLMEYYPLKLHHHETTTGCDADGNDIYLWQALTLVRQYFTSAMLSDMHHRASDGGTYFYQCIGAGGESYLRDDVLERFHMSFAMSTKGKECLKLAVAIIKEAMQDVMKPLLIDQSNINTRTDSRKPRYLTCSKIADDELPWFVGKIGFENGQEED